MQNFFGEAKIDATTDTITLTKEGSYNQTCFEYVDTKIIKSECYCILK